MTIAPDDKDWTWVLERPCQECGYVADDVSRDSVAGRIRENAAVWREALGQPGVRERPSPAVWSALEYACHVRDVDALFATRLRLMLDEDDPLFANWDQDATAVAERYGEQDPETVAVELSDAADTLAGHFDSIAGEQWDRTARRSDGAAFTVTTFARYLIHDLVHHVWDVTGRRADR